MYERIGRVKQKYPSIQRYFDIEIEVKDTVYILYSKLVDRYYVGYTNEIERRLAEHNRKKGKYTDSGIPWHLVYSETYSTKTEAMQREKFIKLKKSRTYIESLISSSAG